MSGDGCATTANDHGTTGRVSAALTPAPRGRLCPADRDRLRQDVARRYEKDKLSIRRVAEEIERSYGLVRRLLLEAKVPLRPPAYHWGAATR